MIVVVTITLPKVSINWPQLFPVVIAYILLITSLVSRRARSFYLAIMRFLWHQPPVAMWILGFGVASLILVLHPGLSDPLDRVAILTIAGMEVVAVSVTFGVLGIQAQHLAETYTRAVARQAAQHERWPIMLVAQALGILYVTVAAIFTPTKAAAVAATLLLAVGLAANGMVVQEFLQRFDPVRLIRLLREGAIGGLGRADQRDAQVVVQTAQPILDLIIRGAEKGDTEVVAEGMAAWRDILARYHEVVVPVWSDGLIEWLFARSQELVETYAPRSSGVVLPTLIEGVMDLGLVCSRYVNPLNRDHDEGTHAACRVLRRAVVRSINAQLSPSADLATASITRLGDACIDVGKVTMIQEPIRILRSIGTQSAIDWPHVASRASSGLAQLAIGVASRQPQQPMSSECAQQAIEAIMEMAGQPDEWLGAAHAVTLPLGNNTLPRLCYALATAAQATATQRRPRGGRTPWDGPCAGVADLCFSMPTRTDLASLIRSNSMECCEEILLVLLSMPYRQPATRLVAELFPRFTELVVNDADGRLGTRRLFGELLLFAYYQSPRVPQAEALIRELITAAASRIAGLDVLDRRRLAPMLRRVGAATFYFRDAPMAVAMARASLPPMPRTRTAIRPTEDLFESGGWIGETFHHRPGLPDLGLENHHLDSRAQRTYLELERRIHRGQPSPVSDDA